MFIDLLSCLCGISQIVVEYYGNGNGTGFWHELNFGKFFWNWAAMAGDCSILFMHWYYEYYNKSENSVVVNIDEINISDGKMEENFPEELGIETEKNDILGVSKNNINSDLDLNKPEQRISHEDKSDLGRQSLSEPSKNLSDLY